MVSSLLILQQKKVKKNQQIQKFGVGNFKSGAADVVRRLNTSRARGGDCITEADIMGCRNLHLERGAALRYLTCVIQPSPCSSWDRIPIPYALRSRAPDATFTELHTHTHTHLILMGCNPIHPGVILAAPRDIRHMFHVNFNN